MNENQKAAREMADGLYRQVANLMNYMNCYSCHLRDFGYISDEDYSSLMDKLTNVLKNRK